jgi:putative DNA primase/helicase
VVEGEKAVRRLACEGILAVCGAYGASTWREIDTQALQHAGVHRAVILPDNDTPGRKFAERIARACHHGGIVAALVYLPNLDHSGDVVDFLDHGGTPDELRKLLATAPPWDPSASDRERAEHVKALARLRQQNCRARRAAARIAKAG